MSIGAALAEEVRRRAAGRCEYCRMHQSLQGATFHIEHIIPESHGGLSEIDNLALACPACKLRKSDRISALDSESDAMVPLYHLRKDDWSDHFVWDGYSVQAKTPLGRATIETLQFNHPRRLLIRKAEESFGLFPA
jgi:HNH endonuclease